MYHEFKKRFSITKRHMALFALSTLPLINALPGRAELADCSLIRKPSGASVGYGQCPVTERCKGSSECIPEFGVKNKDGIFVPAIRDWGSSMPSRGGLVNPVAVAENPRVRGQIWVLNGDDSLTIFYCPGVKDVKYTPEKRRDLASCHFMHRPTGIAFGGAPVDGDVPDFEGQQAQNLNITGTFLTTGGSCNDYTATALMGSDYHQRTCTDFMGPTLWQNDLKTYAIKNNDFYPDDLEKVPLGSHLDMIHQQPFSMGVAWDGEQANYWTWDEGADSKYGSIVLTNITQSHGFGGHKHNSAALYRYKGTALKSETKSSLTIPGQMAKYGNLLIVANPAAGVINVLDTHSGTEDGPVKPEEEWREKYTTYTSIINAGFSELNVAGLVLETPSGLTISEDRLFVSDVATRQIHAIKLDTKSGNHTLIGSINTPAKLITGMTIDNVTERLWFVDSLSHTLSVVEPPCQNKSDCDFNPPSPWGDQCAPDTNENGVTVWQAHLDKSQNYNNWEGCARYYYLDCPGGNVHKNKKLPVCEVNGGTWRDAQVTWIDGRSACDCAPPISARVSGASRTMSSLKIPVAILSTVLGYFFW
ncbi:YncE family protein [Endozoicomonas euniceicola]|uniref:Uncharacterized protein n=1 Tax=Endozoicomonas euniceicola TaxID=1234143 RepID=A0ABY6GUQ6_9GAMM|nr:hypothetical protein [Endozoicomonas euniceicola]UYM16506.1 hypothetical protein NX720_00795 [Endozoicomonas euniceicola]